MGKYTKRQRMQGGLAGLLLLGVGGVASTAAFTDTADVTAQASTGTLTVDFNGNSTVDLNSINAKIFAPGQSESEAITLENAGNIPALVDIAASYVPDVDSGTSQAEADALAAVLDVTWQVGTGTPVTKKLDQFTVADVASAAESSQSVTITVAMPSTLPSVPGMADFNGDGTVNVNDLQGTAVDITLDAVATQDL